MTVDRDSITEEVVNVQDNQITLVKGKLSPRWHQIKLNKNLGLYPAEAAQKILDDVNSRASSPNIGMTYVKPYVDRVLQQQRED